METPKRIYLTQQAFNLLTSEEKEKVQLLRKSSATIRAQVNHERSKTRYATLSKAYKEHKKCADIEQIKQERDYYKKSYENLVKKVLDKQLSSSKIIENDPEEIVSEEEIYE